LTLPIRTAKAATEELVAAIRWYERHRPALAAEFLVAILRTMERIERLPEAGSPWTLMETRRALVPNFPYQIVYVNRSHEIHVLAFAHLKRRPGYWRDRL